MKTTLNLRDDLVRRAKSRAALGGKSLAKYIEEKLEIAVILDESKPLQVSSWIDTLPNLPDMAAKSLDLAIASEDFREIDKEMWK